MRGHDGLPVNIGTQLKAIIENQLSLFKTELYQLKTNFLRRHLLFYQ